MLSRAPAVSSFYHLCKAKLSIGSVIEPGNFGDLVQLYGYKHNAFQREILLEEVRQAIAPTAPSRLRCLFVFGSVQDARTFQMREFSGFGTDNLYEVEPVQDCAPFFCQMSAIENWYQVDLASQTAKAHSYWGQRETAVNGSVTPPPGMGVWAGFQEILLGCAARIVQPIGRMIVT